VLKVHVLESIYPHSRNVAHAVEVPPGARLLYTNGQIGTKLDGFTPESAAEQAVIVFERLATILEAADMSFADIVRFNTYLTDADDIQDYLDVRDGVMGDHKPGNTFFLIDGLVRPNLKVEVEAVAAKVD